MILTLIIQGAIVYKINMDMLEGEGVDIEGLSSSLIKSLVIIGLISIVIYAIISIYFINKSQGHMESLSRNLIM